MNVLLLDVEDLEPVLLEERDHGLQRKIREMLVVDRVELAPREETREMVGATMSQLPTHYREALEAKYVLGKSVRDIAAALHVSEKSVESQLTRARRAFRATFLTLARNLAPEAGT